MRWSYNPELGKACLKSQVLRAHLKIPSEGPRWISLSVRLKVPEKNNPLGLGGKKVGAAALEAKTNDGSKKIKRSNSV